MEGRAIEKACRRCGVCLTLLSALVLSCAPGPSPSAPQTRAPSPTEAQGTAGPSIPVEQPCPVPDPLVSGAWKWEAAPEAPPVTLLGWWGDRLLFEVGDHACSLDPTDGQWLDPGLPAGIFATDGRTLLATDGDHGLVFVDASGRAMHIDLAGRPWLSDWTFQGQIISLATGGYLLGVIPELVTVSDDGIIDDQGPLPAGMLAFAGGGLSGLYAIGRSRPDSPVPAPDLLSLWDAPSGRSLATTTGIDAVVIERTGGGVFVRRHADGSWSALMPSGRMEPVSGALSPPGLLDPTGTWLFVETYGITGCDRAAPPGSCGIELRRASDLALLRTAPGPGDAPAWKDGLAAYVERPTGNARPILVLLTADGVRLSAIP